FRREYCDVRGQPASRRGRRAAGAAGRRDRAACRAGAGGGPCWRRRSRKPRPRTLVGAITLTNNNVILRGAVGWAKRAQRACPPEFFCYLSADRTRALQNKQG